MLYAIADVHGCYNEYQAMLEQIHFCDDDTLYVLGDVIDRRPGGIQILQDMMFRPNVVPLLGNHEFLAAMCLPWLLTEISKESLAKLDDARLGAFQDWMDNGGGPTLQALGTLSQSERTDILDYLREFSLYEEVEVADQSFVLVHAGLGNFSPEKALEDYTLEELLFSRPEPDTVYWPDKTVVFGHTPTRHLSDDTGRIVCGSGWADIDCGCGSGGALGCLCLDTMGEFYV